MFKKILIANRGEIAVRIIRACRELGITTASIYSSADKISLHNKLSDESYLIGQPQSSDSYLNQKKIIDLAKKINADAIHPGYGFLSENPSFIKAVENSGIRFIGPSSRSVEMMGSKTAARKLMQENNVPIVPGTTSPVINSEEGKEAAGKIGYPVLLKASAGGGGKGMRKIYIEQEFETAFESTKREAEKVFGSNDIYIEKLIQNPRHIEVQIIADNHGNFVHLFERECSVQRRHQKIIEEAPSSFVDEKTRGEITASAIKAAKACNYFNAGTIEFLMDANKNFYFLEMNTRIQVEHPVTEMITGVDLVKEQISVAAGNKLSFNQRDLKISGHALECRIYAEDPANNFLPSTGRLYEYIPPSGPGVRVDHGVERGAAVSIYYDPMIAKLICCGKNRRETINRSLRSLQEFHIAGVINNIPFLKIILQNKDFILGNFDINFVEDKIIPHYKRNSFSYLPDEFEAAASLFAVLLKEREFSVRKGTVFSENNNWTKLRYE